MKPFDLEAAKRGEPIFDVLMGVVVYFVGFAGNGDYLIEHLSHLCRRAGNDLRMAEPPRPEWQQKLIDAVKAGKVVEQILQNNEWYKSWLNDHLDNYDFGFTNEDQYRIRPEKVTRYLWACNGEDDWLQSSTFRTEQEAKAFFKCEIKRLDWSATVFEE